MKKLLILMLSAALLLTACGQTMPSGPATQPPKDHRGIMGDALRTAMKLVYDPITVSHGEDYVIEWEDEGMEAHIRFLLDKPEGDILHSDVWDVQLLGIFAKRINGHDVMLTQPPEGWTQFDMSEILLVENKEGIWHEYEGRTFPDIVTLQDLRHFDSLQIFQTSDVSLTDLSGVEQCPHLVRLILPDSSPATLEPLAQMPWLIQLSLGGSTGERTVLDLSPMAGLPELEDLTLFGRELVSLEPLTTLPSLRTLDLGVEAIYPSLEPLTRSTVEYLDLGLSVDGRGKFDHLDYESLARIPNLTYLDIDNHTAFGVEECTAVLEGCLKLKYLDICYTPAANAIKDGDWEPDFSQLEAYMTLPD